MKNIIIKSIALILIAAGCNKKEIIQMKNAADPESAVSIIQNNYDGKIYVTLVSGQNPLAGTTHIIGQFKNNGNYVNVGDFKINGTKVPTGIDGIFYDNGLTTIPNPSCAYLYGLFGKEVTIDISGNPATNYGAGTDKFKLPVIITSSVENDKITQGQGFNISWSGISSENSVIIQVQSKTTDGSEVAGSYRKSFVGQTDDNGSYTIPWNILNEFDHSSVLKIYIYRYTAGEMDCGDKNVSFIALDKHSYGKIRFAN